MDHVSSHRGRDLPAEVLQKLNIVNDRITEDKEDFDINLYPNMFSKPKAENQDQPDLASSRSSVSLSRAPTRSSIVDTIWSRKQSSAVDIGSGLTRTQTWRSERADSVVGGAPIEEEDGKFELNLGLVVLTGYANHVTRAVGGRTQRLQDRSRGGLPVT